MIRITILLAVLFSFSFSHKLNVFTEFEDNKLFVSAYFANGNACQNCKVEIKKNDKLLISSTTNTKGEFEETLKEKEILLSVDAGSGHQVSKIVVQEYSVNTSLENEELVKLQEENKKLKQQVKLLEEKLEQMDIFKTIFALLVIVGIFAFLKRIKK